VRRAPAGCGSVRGDLGFLLSPELDPERAAALREHLESCGACRVVYARVKANYEALRREPAIEPDGEFARRVMDRLPRRVPRRRRGVRLGMIPLILLASGLLPGGLKLAAGEGGLLAALASGLQAPLSAAGGLLVKLVASASGRLPAGELLPLLGGGVSGGASLSAAAGLVLAAAAATGLLAALLAACLVPLRRGSSTRS
jgi:anti-sigma factor RsiW